MPISWSPGNRSRANRRQPVRPKPQPAARSNDLATANAEFHKYIGRERVHEKRLAATASVASTNLRSKPAPASCQSTKQFARAAKMVAPPAWIPGIPEQPMCPDTAVEERRRASIVEIT